MQLPREEKSLTSRATNGSEAAVKYRREFSLEIRRLGSARNTRATVYLVVYEGKRARDGLCAPKDLSKYARTICARTDGRGTVLRGGNTRIVETKGTRRKRTTPIRHVIKQCNRVAANSILSPLPLVRSSFVLYAPYWRAWDKFENGIS